MSDGTKLVGVIGDEDTVTGFILAGIGHRTTEGTNFLVVKSSASSPLFLYRHYDMFLVTFKM